MTAFLGVFALSSLGQLIAAEYFVGTDGRDEQDGRSPQSAFATVQRGLDALETGDTLTILPGEYHGGALREGLGGPEARTVIRAAIPGTVMLRGDVPVSNFQAVEGVLNTWAIDFEGDVQAVLEVDSLTQFPRAPSLAELQYSPGEFYYDSEAGRLYISTTDFSPPDAHSYSVAVTPACGIELVQPTGVTVEGIAFMGFVQEEQKRLSERFGTVWGLWMEGPRDCVVRDCFAILNSGGIAMRPAGRPNNDGGGNLIEDCTAVANYSHSTASIAGISIYNPNDDIIRSCVVYQPQGGLAARFYSGARGPALMDGVVSLGGDLAIKGLGDYTFEAVIRNSVSPGGLNSHILENSVVSSRNLYAIKTDRQTSDAAHEKNVIYLGMGDDTNAEAEFADPINGDFRLQAASRFRGTGENGSDPGITPSPGAVYFLSMAGSDAATGTSVATAWRSLTHAAAKLQAGDTLYITEGVYPGDVTIALKGEGDTPTRILGRGRDRVRIAGKVEIADTRAVEIGRIHFDDTLQLIDSTGVTINNCVFSYGDPGVAATGVRGLRVKHCLFMPTNSAAVTIANSEAVFLQSNLFANRSGASVEVDQLDAIHYSDYNAYEDEDNGWIVAGETVALTALAPLESYALTHPVGLIDSDGTFYVRNSTDFAGRSIRGAAFGPHRYQRSREAVVDNLKVHSVSATTANIEWTSTHPGIFTVAWGETPDTPHRREIIGASFGTFSLTGLEPDRQYYFRIVSGQSTNEFSEGFQADTFKVPAQPLRFHTAATDGKGRIYHVALDGNNANSGLAPDKAWASVSFAASQVRPGDTVLVASGNYSETVRVRASGTADKPITFRAAPGAVVRFQGEADIRNYFVVAYKDNIHIDGFRFDGAAGRSPGQLLSVAAVLAFGADNLNLTRCMLDGRWKQYSRGLGLIMDSNNVRIENCVQMDNMGALQIIDCPNVSITHCFFLRPKIAALEIVNRPGDKAYVANNLFGDSLTGKANSRLIAIGRHQTLHFENNGFYMRRPREERIAFAVYGDPAYERAATAYRMLNLDADPAHPPMEEDHVWRTIQEWDDNYAVTPSNTLFGDPDLAVFQDPVAGEAAAEMVARSAESRPEAKIQRFDWLFSGGKRGQPIGFSELFATNPEFLNRSIGLQPDAFRDLPD